MNLSIKTKLALALSMFAALLLMAGGWLVYRQIKASFYHEFDERLRLQAMSLTTGIKQERSFVDVIFSDKYLREYDDDESRSWFFQIWAPLPVDDAYRPKTMRSDSLKKNQNLPRRFGSLKEPVYWNFELPDGRSGRGIGIRYVPQADDHDRRSNFDKNLKVELVVAQDRTELDQSLRAVAKNIGIAGGVGLLATLLFVPLILLRFLRPLKSVSKQAETIDVESLSTRFDTRVPPEIRPISRALNELLARLESSFDRERQLSSDIAHELRTPISELKSYAELKIKWPDKTEGCFEKEVLQMVAGMESLVENLLTLARMEKSAAEFEGVPVSLTDALSNSVDEVQPAAAARGIRIRNETNPEIRIETHPELLQIILRNLVSNAVAHSPSGGEVQIGSGTDNELLHISNHAPDLSAEDLPRMFDRLWQKDASRSNDEHCGLGLPLARSCARAIGLELTAQLNEENRLEMILIRFSSEGT